jgi:hypothetical protein
MRVDDYVMYKVRDIVRAKIAVLIVQAVVFEAALQAGEPRTAVLACD